jgi:phenylalanyl-tRNA synthetase alpha chain
MQRATTAQKCCRSRARICFKRTCNRISNFKSFATVNYKESECLTREDFFTADPANNVTEYIFEKLDKNLHRKPDHPIGILKSAIEEFFNTQHLLNPFNFYDQLSPIVTTYANFDSVLVPPDHISRSPNDTYYVTSNTVLRCHTSAHQLELLKSGARRFLVTGDVYRRDSIDATHFPVFHQMEGVCVFEPREWESRNITSLELTSSELRTTLEGLVRYLFGQIEMRWVDAYFPFTEPSYELEIFFNGEWLEVLGCGIMQQAILEEASLDEHRAWAFGLGLERLAMILFEIPDIRLFWTSDSRFSNQFKAGMFRTGGLGMKKFSSYSKYPPCYKDASFWLPKDSFRFTENTLCELVRDVAGNLIEEVKLIDEFYNPKLDLKSNCFRFTYRSMDRSLTDDEVNLLQEQVRARLVSEMEVTLR